MLENPIMATLVALFMITWAAGMVIQFILRRKLKQRGEYVGGSSGADNLRFLRMIFSKEWLDGQDPEMVKLCLAYKLLIGAMLGLLLILTWGFSAFRPKAEPALENNQEASAQALPGSEAI